MGPVQASGSILLRRVGTVVGLAALSVLTACGHWVVTFDGNQAVKGATEQRTGVLTPDGTDSYQFAAVGDAVHVTAPASNHGGNLRTVFWPAGARVVADSESCATWTVQKGGLVQQGAALRIRRSPGGRIRALTVTKNIWYLGTWVFNFHTMDSGREQPFEQFGSVAIDKLKVDGFAQALPWRFCARVRGSRLEFKVWPTKIAEPAWGDLAWGGARTVPAGWEAAGTTGWYAGHVPPGGSASYEGLRTARFVLPK